MLKLSASINPCPEDLVVDYSKTLQKLDTDYIHLDVMRENFVGHDALSINTIYEIYDNTLVPLDCHLMIDEPLSVLKEYLKIKLNIITIHYEAFKNKKDLLKAIKMIKDKHVLVGLSIKPNTFIKDIMDYLPLIDLVLIMGVEPGKSGQKMITNTIPKIKELRSIIYDYRYDLKIEVDFDGRKKVFSIKGKEKPQSIYPRMKGCQMKIKFISSCVEADVSNPQIVVGVL